MGFEELFENNRKEYRNYRGTSSPDDSQYSYDSGYPHQDNENSEKWQNILEKIRSNKKLRFFVILTAILIATLVIALIVILFPLIIKLINYITQNGLQGVIDESTGFIDKILNGTSN
jgi:predicted nucleic acid-binding Zn ribbon protein